MDDLCNHSFDSDALGGRDRRVGCGSQSAAVTLGGARPVIEHCVADRNVGFSLARFLLERESGFSGPLLP